MMADDPWGQYLAPPSGSAADPWAQFTKPPAQAAAPAAAAPAAQDLGSTAIWNKPSDASWPDYLLAHLAKSLPSFDPHVNANEAVLLGSGLSGGLSGYIPGMRERTAQAEQETPLGNRIALQGAGYMLGPGKLGIASKLGEALGGGYLAGIGGAAGEGALSSAVGTAGAGGSASDIGKAAGIGALGGGAGGSLGGVVGRGGTLAPAQTADDLHAAAKQAYDPLSNILYDATKEVHPTLDVTDAQNALRDWSGYKWGDASKTSKEVNTLLDKPQLSANDIQQSQSYLKGIAKNPTTDPNDALYASHYVGKLQDVLDNGTPQTGVPQNWTPPATPSMPAPAAGQGTMRINGQPFPYANGQWTQPSFASATKAAGDVLHGQANDVGRLDNWIAKSNVAGGPDVGGQASQYLRSPAGQTFAAPGTPQYDAINALAKTNAGPDLSAAPSLWDIRHAVHPLVSGAAGGLATGLGGQLAEGHFDPAHLAGEVAAGAALGYGLHKGVPWASQKFIQGPAQQSAIDAARSTLSTGQLQAPVYPTATIRDALRTLLYGQGAGGRF
jgi:hypothetical protein